MKSPAFQFYPSDWKEKADRWTQNPPIKGTLMMRIFQ